MQHLRATGKIQSERSRRRAEKERDRMSWRDDPVTVQDLVTKIETAKAFGILVDEDEVVWLPKSQIESHTLVVGQQGMAVMPRWLADKYEFDYD